MSLKFLKIAFLTLAIFVISCDDDGIQPDNGIRGSSKKLTRESHYVYETDELLREVKYHYNASGSMSQEIATDLRANDSVTLKYEYNTEDLLAKLITQFSDGTGFAITYSYEKGLKKVEELEQTTGIHRQVFYYTVGRLDSIESYHINPEAEPDWLGAHLFTYDNGLLAKESFKVSVTTNEGPKMLSWDGMVYTYDDGLLQAACLGEVECTKYIYDYQNRVVTMIAEHYGEERLLEERSYEMGLLKEKTMYHYSVYSGPEFIDKTRVRYSYE